MLCVLALMSLVGGTILFKLFAPRQGLWIGNGVQSLAAGIAMLPFALGFESFHDIVPSTSLIVAFAYNVLFVSVFAYLLWFRILQVSGPPRRAAITSSFRRSACCSAGCCWASIWRPPISSASCRWRSASILSPRPARAEGDSMTNPRFTLIGGPTVLIEIAGLRLVTDPTFDGPGDYKLPQSR